MCIRDRIDLVAATVHAPGLVEHLVVSEDLVDGRPPTRGIVFTEYVIEITGQQGRYAVGHGWSPLQIAKRFERARRLADFHGTTGESGRTAHRPAHRVPVIPETRALSPMQYADRRSHPNVS